MLIVVGSVFGLIFGFKLIKTMMISHYIAHMKTPAVAVSTRVVSNASWQKKLSAVGNVRAVVGVNVTTELAGMVEKIYFKPGAWVKKNDILVQLNADAEQGQLQSLIAQSKLAEITYQRDKAQFTAQAVSKQTVDSDEWSVKNLAGQVAQQQAIVDKKTIRAPFAGRLGILAINPGQYLNVGDKITSLQTFNPIYIDFYLPQQSLAKLKLNQSVHITTDVYPKQLFTGQITTIEPNIDVTTRNVEIEATVINPKNKLVPGMFVALNVDVGNPRAYLTVPPSAISFNPYGDIVYVVYKNNDRSKETQLMVKQVFVTVGDQQDGLVAILSGLKAGDEVVTSGQLKLKNNSVITINNLVTPSQSGTA